jgi:hypothetical protein
MSVQQEYPGVQDKYKRYRRDKLLIKRSFIQDVTVHKLGGKLKMEYISFGSAIIRCLGVASVFYCVFFLM